MVYFGKPFLHFFKGRIFHETAVCAEVRYIIFSATGGCPDNFHSLPLNLIAKLCALFAVRRWWKILEFGPSVSETWLLQLTWFTERYIDITALLVDDVTSRHNLQFYTQLILTYLGFIFVALFWTVRVNATKLFVSDSLAIYAVYKFVYLFIFLFIYLWIIIKWLSRNMLL